MYEYTNDKIFVVDYFIYNPSNPIKKIFTNMLPSVSRKSAEQATRDLERGSKITIVKIQSFSVNSNGGTTDDTYSD